MILAGEPMTATKEIPVTDISAYASSLREFVEGICTSPAFCNSPKSCEFLRHIVERTLCDDVASLKERLIGMTLLGRDAGYDTGSDAGVRVRAKEVRKRLLKYNTTLATEARLILDLPVGSYVPRFFEVSTFDAEVVPDTAAVGWPEITVPLQPLPLQYLATPTLAALFLCIICIRWQIAQEHPFTTFWQGVFGDHHAVLYLPDSQNAEGQQAVGFQEVEAATALSNLAGEFHANLNLAQTESHTAMPGEVVLSVGSAATHGMGQNLRSDDSLPSGVLAPDDRAAWLTVINGDQRKVHIGGTDPAAVRALVDQLCKRDTFPEGLEGSLQNGTTTELVMLMPPHAGINVYHKSLPPDPSSVGTQ